MILIKPLEKIVLMKYLISFFAFALLSVSGIAQNQFYLNTELDIWSRNAYSQSVANIKNHINVKGYKSATVPQQLIYYKGVAYCSDQKIRKGINNFDWILSNFLMSDNALRLIQTQKLNCFQGTDHTRFSKLYGQNMLNDGVVYLVEVSQPGIRASTKGGRISWDDAEVAQVNSDEFMGEEPISEEDLKKWLPRDTSEDSIRHNLNLRLTDRIDEVSILQSDHFILVDFGNNSNSKITSQLAEIEKSYEFIYEYYDLKVPAHKITIYITDGKSEFAMLGKELHGLNLSDHLLGYSVNPDLSIVAYTPNFYVGTIKHELAHLLLNNNYQAMAPWLAEGIPTIYEVSEWFGNELKGVDNWRGPILKEAKQRSLVPPLRKLLGYNWLEFNGHTDSGYDKIRLSINHALARYFSIFLEDKGKLREILKAYAERNPDDMEGTVADNAVLIVEKSLGKSIEEIEIEFERWVRQFR